MRRTILIIPILLFSCAGGSLKALTDTPASSSLFIENEAKRIEGLRSLLVFQGDRHVFKGYYRPFLADSLDHVRSVTKSVIGLLIGIAIDKGYIPNTNTPIDEFLEPEWTYDRSMGGISIEHLLTMTGGFEWNEWGGIGFNEWVTSSDPIRFVLSKPVTSVPGSHFSYNSGSTHLLSVILSKATGMSTLEFARQYLFGPMGIEKVRWTTLGKYYNGGAGLQLKPEDMIKIGRLVVEEGRWNGKVIVSEDWIRRSISPIIPGAAETTAYGYLWWIASELDTRNVAAVGYGGQLIVILPDLKVVMVATSEWTGPAGRNASVRHQQITKLMTDHIYPYIKEQTL